MEHFCCFSCANQNTCTDDLKCKKFYTHTCKWLMGNGGCSIPRDCFPINRQEDKNIMQVSQYGYDTVGITLKKWKDGNKYIFSATTKSWELRKELDPDPVGSLIKINGIDVNFFRKNFDIEVF